MVFVENFLFWPYYSRPFVFLKQIQLLVLQTLGELLCWHSGTQNVKVDRHSKLVWYMQPVLQPWRSNKKGPLFQRPVWLFRPDELGNSKVFLF